MPPTPPPTPPQRADHILAGYLGQELTEWNTTGLFPEGLGGKDPTLAREAGLYFLQTRAAELESLKPKIADAAGRRDGSALLRVLDETLLVEHEIQRARVYFKLLSVQHPQIPAFADLYETVANRCNALDATAESLPQTLSTVPAPQRQSMLESAPGLSDHMHALFPEKYGRFPGLDPQQGAALSERISNAKTAYLHDYHLAHAKSSVPATDTARLNQTAEAFNAMLATTTEEARALGYASPLHHFAAWQHLPAPLVDQWLTRSARPAAEAAERMHTLLTGNRSKTQMIRMHYPDGSPQKYSLLEARSIVTEALCKFNSSFRPILDDAFEKGWLQTKPLGNNPYGGETYNNLPKIFYDHANPMVLSEFRGGVFDVLRLAHELGGHCLSIELANRNRQALHVADSTLQESFALFSQRLVSDEMLARTENPVQRAVIQRTIADDWYQNLYETTARCRFQQAAYRAATEPDGSLRHLDAPELTRIFAVTNAPIRYGNARTDPNESTRWANIHHFVTQMPYYNAAYGFATMASGALYGQWRNAATAQRTAIAKRWTDVMAQGGTVRFPDAMGYLGIDVRSPAFMHAGMQTVDQSILKAGEAMDSVSGLGLFLSLTPGQMWQVGREKVKRLFSSPETKSLPLPTPKGNAAVSPSHSAPAQPLYGLTPAPAAQSADASLPVAPLGNITPPSATVTQNKPDTRWTERTQPTPARPLPHQTHLANSWREQALGSQQERGGNTGANPSPSVPTWAI